MASDPRLPQPLDCANLAKEWPRWKQSIAIYLRATVKITEKEENKVATFLWTIGPRGVEIFHTLYPDAANAANLFGENESEVEDEGVADAAEEEGEAIGASTGFERRNPFDAHERKRIMRYSRQPGYPGSQLYGGL